MLPLFHNRTYSRPFKWAIRLAYVFVILVGVYLCRAPLLTGIANAWIVNEPVTKADAIVVLGGGLEYRPFAAARLYAGGTAPNILIAQPELAPTAQMGLTQPESVIAREVLLKKGVPEAAIQMIGTNVTSTRQEAQAVREWVRNNSAHSLLIPTDLFHTRRARWIFAKTLRDINVELRVTAIDPPQYQNINWWLHEEGLIAFQNEVIKLLYYWVRY